MPRLQPGQDAESMVYLAQENDRSSWLLPRQGQVVFQEFNGMVAVDLEDFDTFFEMVVRTKVRIDARRANTVVPMRGR